MIRLITYFAIVAISTIALLIANPQGAARDLLSSVAIGFAIPLIDALVRHWDIARFAIMSMKAWNKDVRISISYLFRIRVQDRYLLIRSRRFGHFQPVGGVFKYYPSAKGLFDKIEARDDDLFPIDEQGIGDLRLTIKGRNLARFFDWFNSRRGRETDVWREFNEELILPGLLSSQTFRFIRAEFVRTRDTGLRWSNFVGRREIVFAEIYELLPTPEQGAALERLIGVEDEALYWATASEIAHQGASAHKGVAVPISDHSAWIL